MFGFLVLMAVLLALISLVFLLDFMGPATKGESLLLCDRSSARLCSFFGKIPPGGPEPREAVAQCPRRLRETGSRETD